MRNLARVLKNVIYHVELTFCVASRITIEATSTQHYRNIPRRIDTVFNAILVQFTSTQSHPQYCNSIQPNTMLHTILQQQYTSYSYNINAIFHASIHPYKSLASHMLPLRSCFWHVMPSKIHLQVSSTLPDSPSGNVETFWIILLSFQDCPNSIFQLPAVVRTALGNNAYEQCGTAYCPSA
jgi:hypothetical protein